MKAASAADQLRTVDSIVVIASVANETNACADRGDLPTAETRQQFYALASDAAKRAGGRVVKAVGSGVLMTFPIERARDVLPALEWLQREGTQLWRTFDSRCHVQLKVGAGSVVAGPMGPPDDLRWDICGDTVNRLFKLPVDDLVISPEARSLLR